LKRFRERAQAPMVRLASEYFGLMTGGRYPKLVVDASAERPVLQAEGADGRVIGIEAMSEGTTDQLYLALRLAALELQRGNGPAMPLVLDDVLMTSDDTRATHIFQALARFAQGGQVLLFTHHQHLVQVAQTALPRDGLVVHYL
jgi:exonuclease SbcC